MELKLDQGKIKEICEQNDINYLALFGSYAREDQGESSDVDLLVDFTTTKSLLEKGRAIVAFEDLFGRPVDLVNRNFIKPRIRPYILQDAKTLYERQ